MGGGEIGAPLYTIWGGDVDETSIRGQFLGVMGEVERKFSGAFYAFPVMYV